MTATPGGIVFIRSLDNLIDGSRNLLARQTGRSGILDALRTKAALDIDRTKEAAMRLGQGIKTAARNVGDDITYRAAMVGDVAPLRAYEETTGGREEWQVLQNLAQAGYDPRQLKYLEQRAMQSPGILLDRNRMAEELMHINADDLQAVDTARANAAQYTKQRDALERFVTNHNPEFSGYLPEDRELYAALKQRRLGV